MDSQSNTTRCNAEEDEVQSEDEDKDEGGEVQESGQPGALIAVPDVAMKMAWWSQLTQHATLPPLRLPFAAPSWSLVGAPDAQSARQELLALELEPVGLRDEQDETALDDWAHSLGAMGPAVIPAQATQPLLHPSGASDDQASEREDNSPAQVIRWLVVQPLTSSDSAGCELA